MDDLERKLASVSLESTKRSIAVSTERKAYVPPHKRKELAAAAAAKKLPELIYPLFECVDLPPTYTREKLKNDVLKFAKDFKILSFGDGSAVVEFISLEDARSAFGGIKDVKMRPIAPPPSPAILPKTEGTPVKKDDLMTNKRPQTSALVAHRMISNALGLKVNSRSPQREKADREKLAKARADKQ